MDKKSQINIWYLVAAVLAIMFIQSVLTQSQRIESIPYSDFERDLAEGRIERVVIRDRHILGTYKQPRNGKTEFISVFMPDRCPGNPAFVHEFEKMRPVRSARWAPIPSKTTSGSSSS